MVSLADRVSAHEESSRRIAVSLAPLPARLAHVKIQLQRTLADEILVENRTGTLLEVLDDHGVAFLRIGPAGAEANLTAPAWYETVSVDDVPIPPAARRGATPRWVRVATDPAWGWFDRRLRRVAAADAHAAGKDTGRVENLGGWTIPLRFGGVPVALHGRFQLAPTPAGVFTTRLTSPEEPFPGVRVQLIAGRIPALYLENTGDEPVVVLGAAGEPFLRIGPEGTSANVRSPTWQRTGKAEVTTTAPPIDAKTAPAWRTQSSTPRYAWIEFRAAPPATEPPRALARTHATVRRWTVPLRRGAVHAVVGGAIEWIPSAEAAPPS